MLYGLWDDRLVWLSWLIDTAEGRGDWLTVLNAIASKAITLTLMNRYKDAEDCFKEGQKYQSYAEPHVKVRLFMNNAYLYIYLNDLDKRLSKSSP